MGHLLPTGGLLVLTIYLGLTSLCQVHAKDVKYEDCYVCSGYIEQCQERIDYNKDYIYQKKCRTACFVRMGEDDALYRGCFDGFMEIEELKSLRSFVGGCKNVTWNNRELPWCMCKGALCNAASMYDMKTGVSHDTSAETNWVDSSYAKQGYDTPYEEPNEPYYAGDGYTGATFEAESPYEPEPTYELQEEYKDINHAEAYQHSYDGYDQSPDYFPKLDDFHESQKHLDDQEPKEEEYDPYNKPRYDAPGPNNAIYHEGDAYLYPPFRNVPPYGHPAFYRDNNAGAPEADNDGYKPEEKQAPEHNDVQEDYPPPEESQYYGHPNEVYSEEPQKDYEEEPEEKKEVAPAFPEHLAARIQCAKTGFYQNPEDCRTFVACVLDPHYRMPYMHLMRCPAGLVWDNVEKICMEYSTTCNVGGAAPTDNKEEEEEVVDYALPTAPGYQAPDAGYQAEDSYQPDEYQQDSYQHEAGYHPESYQPDTGYQPENYNQQQAAYNADSYSQPDAGYQPDSYSQPETGYKQEGEQQVYEEPVVLKEIEQPYYPPQVPQDRAAYYNAQPTKPAGGEQTYEEQQKYYEGSEYQPK